MKNQIKSILKEYTKVTAIKESTLDIIAEKIEKNLLIKQSLEAKFWKFVEKAGWLNDQNYTRINKKFKSLSKEEQKELSDAFNKFHEDLYDEYKKDWIGTPGIEVSDDGWSDLRAEVIGRGKNFYDNISAEQLREMALNRDYKESFSYCFHSL